MRALLERLWQRNDLLQDETADLIRGLNEQTLPLLQELALRTKMRLYGKSVYLRGLIEFSSYCSRDCLYCGIRGPNREAQRYRLSPAEILACCREGYALGYRTFVLQSGEDPWYTVERLVAIIRDIKRECPDAAVTLSLGERSEEEYRAMFAAGADRYLLRHETASRRLYEALHPTMDFAKRRKCLFTLKAIGFQVGAGFMVGLPGQTAEDLAEDLHFLKTLQPDMIGIGPFIPHRQTPLAAAKAGSLGETLKMVALARLFVPEALIPATTAMGTVHPRGRELALKSGANVVMPNLSPQYARPKYALYDNKICLGDESAQCRACVEMRIRFAGFQADMGRGDSLRHLAKT